MRWAPWQGATRCTTGPTPGALALRDWLLAEYPAGRSGGIFNCRNVRGSQQPSIHGEGRAFDLMLPVVNGRGHPDGHDVVRRLGSAGVKLGIQTCIFDRTIWSARSPQGRPYTGVHPHYDHVHVELTPAAGRTLTRAALTAELGSRAPAPAPRPTIRQGARGQDVVDLQRALGGLTADGIFGPATDRAVRDYQRRSGLTVDGIVGRRTWASLGL